MPFRIENAAELRKYIAFFLEYLFATNFDENHHGFGAIRLVFPKGSMEIHAFANSFGTARP